MLIKTCLRLAAVGLLLVSSMYAHAEYQSDSINLYRQCGIAGMKCANPQHESEMLRLFESRRDGDRLCVLLKGHIQMELCMTNEHKGDGRSVFTLIGYLRAHNTNYYVVRHSGYETAAVILVDTTTGQYGVFSNLPILSPDGKLAAIARTDLDARYFANEISIVRLDKQGIRSVKRFETPAMNAKWISNTKIMFDRMMLDGKGELAVKSKGELKSDGQSWKLIK